MRTSSRRYATIHCTWIQASKVGKTNTHARECSLLVHLDPHLRVPVSSQNLTREVSLVNVATDLGLSKGNFSRGETHARECRVVDPVDPRLRVHVSGEVLLEESVGHEPAGRLLHENGEGGFAEREATWPRLLREAAHQEVHVIGRRVHGAQQGDDR